MNRLIIIGNGFDLAHGIKTSFHDFILDYFCNIWEQLSSGRFEDQLIEVGSVEKYFKENKDKFSQKTAFSFFNAIQKDYSYIVSQPYMLIRSHFFKSIFSKIVNLRWADIEIEYYNELMDIIEKANRNKESVRDRIELERDTLRLIRNLNSDLDFLKDLLIEYLKKQQNWFFENGIIDNTISKYFNEGINEGENEKTQISDKNPKELLYLNFNYTNTLSRYWDGSNIIHIHGTLENNPIFGFGDDTSDKYKLLENEYNNEALKKIKSFKYSKDGNYHKLVNFIEQDEFQVHVYGHSCGVSDRTLFKQIFENEKCQSIKIFHYDEKDFDEKMYEISRHFDNKTIFLRKVVSFNNLRTMPQPKDKIESCSSEFTAASAN